MVFRMLREGSILRRESKRIVQRIERERERKREKTDQMKILGKRI